jgi:hypothetical protein
VGRLSIQSKRSSLLNDKNLQQLTRGLPGLNPAAGLAAALIGSVIIRASKNVLEQCFCANSAVIVCSLAILMGCDKRAPVSDMPSSQATAPVAVLEFRGASDASAVTPLGSGMFAIASDERSSSDENFILTYDLKTRRLVGKLNLNPYLSSDPPHPDQDDPKKPEFDIEAAARVGDRVYWITSHGRDSAGKEKKSRRRFFATDMKADGTLEFVGQPYYRLLNALSTHPNTKSLNLHTEEAPERGGLNIEGLAAADGGDLLIGFRSPVIGGKALLVPLKNPAALISNNTTAPDFARPIFLRLRQDRGVRDLLYRNQTKDYLILAGPVGAQGQFSLFQWDGRRDSEPVELPIGDMSSVFPESILNLIADTGEVLLLSDDGDCIFQEDGTCFATEDDNRKKETNKKKPDAARRFRGVSVRLP